MFLFDLQAYIEEMRENPDKKEIVEQYENIVETLEGKEIQDLRFYQEYYSKIKAIPYNVPEELIEEFDWDLLAKLVIGSFSSDYSFESNENEKPVPEFLITVSSGKQTVSKTISELWSFQILRLYEIYLEEALKLQTVKEEDELNSIAKERKLRITIWSKHYNKLACKYGNSEIKKIKNELGNFIDL